MKTLILLLTISLNLTFTSKALSLDSKTAPLVENSAYIKRQVKFWRQVFLKTSVGQTIIHDRFEPSIIYATVNHYNQNHSQRINKTRRVIRKVRSALRSIHSKKFRNLSKYQRRIFAKIPRRSRKNFRKRVKGVRYQQGMKEAFKQGLERSFVYLDEIKEIFKKYGVPEDIAYLPHVESSFNYKAYSRVGAAGIWQFMPSSARLYDLSSSETIDERLDPLKASHAAARMLRDNFKILKAWPLAITAYNFGPGSLRKASRRLKTKKLGRIIHGIKSRRFSFASRNFYGSFLAARSIAKDYQKYFDNLKVLKPENITSITLAKNTKVSELKKEYELETKEFRNLNPFIKRVSFKKDLTLKKGTTLTVPQVIKSEREKSEDKESLLSRIKNFFS